MKNSILNSLILSSIFTFSGNALAERNLLKISAKVPVSQTYQIAKQKAKPIKIAHRRIDVINRHVSKPENRVKEKVITVSNKKHTLHIEKKKVI